MPVSRARPRLLLRRHLVEAMKTLDYSPERYGTISSYLGETERLYAGLGKGRGRD